MYYVNKATYNDYHNAYWYGHLQADANKPYGLTPGPETKSFYCSELVYRAWYYAGYRVGSISGEDYWRTGYVLPKDLMTDYDTVRYIAF